MDVEIGKGEVFKPSGEYKKVICEGSAKIKGLLKAEEVLCKGKLDADELRVSRIVTRGLVCKRVDADELISEFLQAGSAYIKEAQINGSARISGSFTSRKARIGGSLDCNVLEADELMVSGSLRAVKARADVLSIKGSLDMNEGDVRFVEVDGSARLGNCRIGEIRVGGKLTVTGKSEIMKAKSSMADIRDTLRGGSFEVSYSLKVDGELEARILKVNGAIKASGRVVAGEAQVSGEVKGRLTGNLITVRGEAGEVEGKEVELINADVSKVVAEKVRVRDSRVGVIEAKEVEILGNSVVSQVTADRVYLAGGAVDTVYYVEKLLVAPEAKVRKERRIG